MHHPWEQLSVNASAAAAVQLPAAMSLMVLTRTPLALVAMSNQVYGALESADASDTVGPLLPVGLPATQGAVELDAAVVEVELRVPVH